MSLKHHLISLLYFAAFWCVLGGYLLVLTLLGGEF